MWRNKTFKTRDEMLEWIAKNGHSVQFEEIFIDNGYGVTYRKLRAM